MSYVCAYSSVQLDKSGVEKEFTTNYCSDFEAVNLTKKTSQENRVSRLVSAGNE